MQKSNKKIKKSVVKIEFPNDKSAEEFLTWLCESGEQEYWTWMECTSDGTSTVNFNYCKKGSNKFCKDLTVTTEFLKKRN